jgi:hypothetical protein
MNKSWKDTSEFWKVTRGWDTHTDGLTFDEATDLAAELNETFNSISYNAEPDPEYGEREEPRAYSNNAVDGWEDMYPDRDC